MEIFIDFNYCEICFCSLKDHIKIVCLQCSKGIKTENVDEVNNNKFSRQELMKTSSADP